MPSPWSRIESLFADALQLSPEKRAAFVEQASGGDSHIYQEVLALLEHFTAAEAWFADAGGDIQQALDAETTQMKAGTRLGAYALGEEVGRGGMAVVYAGARVDGQYEEEVAIKVLKKGLDTTAMLARFRYEGQVLVNLRHPGIANMLDAGQTEDGQPWLVMEYIEGLHLMDWVESQKPDRDSRLRLFRQIVAAVQHAHSRLVVHRDLKPANILVTKDGQAKLLDFGIAKLLDRPAGSVHTEATQRLLTPQYAAPEQLAGASITTATDVYQLGIVLHELLTGQRPEGGVSKALPLDLLYIIRQAMREEPERRYSSAGALGDDIEAFLNKTPIQARPESISYRLGRFIQRNKALTAASALVLFSLLGGIGATSWQWSRAEEALEQEIAAREEAETVTAFTTYLFERLNPYESQDTVAVQDMTMQEFVDMSLPIVQSDLADQPRLHRRLLGIISSLYNSLDQPQMAYELALENLGLTEEVFGGISTEYASAVHDLAGTALDLGKYEEADSLYALAVEASKEAFGTAPRHLAVTYNDYAVLREYQGRYREADTLYQKGLDIMRINNIPDTGNYAMTQNNRAGIALSFEESPRAWTLIREAKDILHEAHYDGTVFMAHIDLTMGRVYMDMDSLDKAEAQFTLARDAFLEFAGENGYFTILSMARLADLKRKQEDYPAVQTLSEEVLDRLLLLYGTENPRMVRPMIMLAESIYKQGNYATASRELDRAFALIEDDSPPRLSLPALELSGLILLKQGKPVAAKQRALEIETILQTLPSDDPLHKHGQDLEEALEEL